MVRVVALLAARAVCLFERIGLKNGCEIKYPDVFSPRDMGAPRSRCLRHLCRRLEVQRQLQRKALCERKQRLKPGRGVGGAREPTQAPAPRQAPRSFPHMHFIFFYAQSIHSYKYSSTRVYSSKIFRATLPSYSSLLCLCSASVAEAHMTSPLLPCGHRRKEIQESPRHVGLVCDTNFLDQGNDFILTHTQVFRIWSSTRRVTSSLV